MSLNVSRRVAYSLITFFATGLALFSVFFTSTINAIAVTNTQEKIEFSTLDVERHLPHPFIKSIIQDAGGFIWIATQGGISRFDGEQSKFFTYSPEQDNGLTNGKINRLLVDSKGRFWAAGKSGLYLYQPQTQYFENLAANPELSFVAMAEDKDNNIWAATKYSGLLKLDTYKNKIEPVQLKESLQNLVISESNSIVIDELGTIRVTTQSHGLLVSTDGGHSFSQIADTLPSDLNNLLKYKEFLLITSQKYGVFLLDAQSHTLIKHYTYSDSICFHQANELMLDHDDRIWVGGDVALCRLDLNNDRLDVFQTDKHSSTPRANITSLYQDAGGVIWLGSQYGVDFWNAKLNNFRHVVNDGVSGLNSNIVTSFASDKDNNLYVGTWDAGINIFDQELNKIAEIRQNSQPDLRQDNIASLLVDKNNLLWIGLYEAGVQIFDLNQQKFVELGQSAYPELEFCGIDKIVQLDDHKIAFSAWGESLFEYQGKQQKFVDLLNAPNLELPNYYFSDYTLDTANNLWLTTLAGGIVKYNLNQPQSQTYNVENSGQFQLKSNDILSVLNTDKFIWFSTQNTGVIKLSKTSQDGGQPNFLHITTRDGLASNVVYNALEDEQGYIWLSHAKGISRLHPQSNQINNFTTKHGLQRFDVNASAYHKDKNNRLYFGGNHGFSTFKPEQVSINNHKPQLQLTKFLQNNQDTPISTLVADGVLELPYNNTNIDLEFAALDFTQPQNNQYQYKLESAHTSNWVDLGTNNHLSITNLLPGTYKLVIKGSNNDGVWSDNLVIPIQVLSPWYANSYAYFSYAILALLAVLSIMRQQQIKYRRQLSHERRLHKLAYSDSLTGLPNRQSFYDTLEKFLMLAKRGNYRAAVMFIDLDRFKRINDTLGHDYGDMVLQEVAKRLQDSVRQSDVITRHTELNTASNEIARLGGDEFTLFLSQIESVEQTSIITKRILNSLSKPIKLEQYEVTVTPSIGIAIYPDNGLKVQDLMKHADIAMYQAKEEGRRTFKYYSNSLNDRALERLQIEEYMRSAVENQEFELVFQPQVDLIDNRVTKAEALVRWSQPKLGYVSPGDFIPIAEESGLIIELGDWILEAACMQAKEWLDQGLENCRISVNVSSVQFKQTALIETVRSALRKSKLPPHLLELELTESAVMSDVEDNIERLSEFKDMGITIAVDDFGTGYSSLSYLKRFPIDTLKIDRTFIDEIASSENDVAIVKAIMVLAETMQLKVVAEGVETLEQLKILNDFGCQFVQGFYFSKPLKQQDFVKFVQQGYGQDKAMWKLELIGTR